MKLAPLLAVSAAIVALGAPVGSAQAAVVDINALTGVASISLQLDPGTYQMSVIDNTAAGGYNGWVYANGSLIREAFDVAFDSPVSFNGVAGGAGTYSFDKNAAASPGLGTTFQAYASGASGVAAFSTGPYVVYSGATDAKYGNNIVTTEPTLQFTLTGPTSLVFSVPDNLLIDNLYGVSVNVTAVPEPASIALMLAGLAAIAVRRRQSA